MVGRVNAKRGANRVFELFQNRRLLQELIYRVFDEVVVAVFPEVEPWVREQAGTV